MSLPFVAPAPAEFSPRSYQMQARAGVHETWEETPAAMLVMATGTGKTLTALFIAQEFLEAGERVVWLAHREELLDQPLKDLRKFWPHVSGGIVQADRDCADAQIVFASVDTLRNDKRLQAVLESGRPALVVVDEAHHSTSPTHQKAIQGFTAKGTRFLGLTATPDREDGADLSERWTVAYSLSTTEAVSAEFLVPPYAAVSRLPNLDLSKVTGRWDYDDAALGRELLLAGVVEHTVAELEKTHLATRLPDRDGTKYLGGRGRPALVFTATVEQARLTAEALREAGWAARYVCGETPKADRRRLLKAFEAGQLDVLCNAAVLTEGTDLPRAATVVLARPTRSWSLYVQMVGRCLRLYPGKDEGFVLDLAGATEDHSLVAAPVLIGGTRCPESPNGAHDYRATATEKGECVHCGRKIPCFASLEAGYDGNHKWVDTEPKRACAHCTRPQCEGSKDGRHHWIPQEGFKRACLDCGTEVPDPHAGLLTRKPMAELAEVDWIRVPDVTPETWVVDVGEHGMLFVAGERAAGLWNAYWLKKGGRKARALSASPIPRDLVRTYADDLVRRAARIQGFRPPSDKQRAYADQLGVDHSAWRTSADGTREIIRARARERALAVGIAVSA